jgi:hypothetical protein
MMNPSTTCKPPEDTYMHNGGAASVTGGLIPATGCGWAAFEQRYIFGDYNRNIAWTLDVKPDRTGAVPGSRKDFARVPTPVSFRTGPDAALYVVSNGDGSVKRIAPRLIPQSCGGGGGATDGGGGLGSGLDAGMTAGRNPTGCSCNLGGTRGAAATGGVSAILGLLTLIRARRRMRTQGTSEEAAGFSGQAAKVGNGSQLTCANRLSQ